MQQSTALDILKSGENVFLTGSAGTGKTYVLNEYIQYLKERNVPVAVTASTGIAATHINGQTIHSWSGLGIKDEIHEEDLVKISKRKKVRTRLENTQVLIIDEISMLSGKLLTCIDQTLRYFKISPEPFGGVQIVLCGDFFQLPPVSRDIMSSSERFAFMAPIWVQADLTICYLTTQYRQGEDPLLTLLSQIRSGSIDEDMQELINEKLQDDSQIDLHMMTKLFTHNADVDSINAKELDLIPSPSETFVAKSYGDKHVIETIKKSVLAPEELVLKVGARIMFVRNNYEAGYLNGTLGVVTEFDSLGSPIVQTQSGDMITVNAEDWMIEDEGYGPIASYSQIPLRLAWAITVHKSQGMTLDSAVIDLSRAFEPGQGYVALSRVRSWSGLYLVGCNRMAFEMDPLVMKADVRFQELSAESEIRKGDIPTNLKQRAQEEFILSCGGTNDPAQIQVLKQQLDTPKTVKEKPKKQPTMTETFSLISEGLSVEQVAKKRNLTVGTIIGHVEQLTRIHPDLYVELPLPDDDILLDILETLDEIYDSRSKDMLDEDNRVRLGSLHHALGGRYDYEILRIVRLYRELSDQSR